MYRTHLVLALLALYVGLAHSFSCDIVVAVREQLQFYNNNGTRTYTEATWSSRTPSIAYDPVHNRVLFGDSFSIKSFDIATRKLQSLYKSEKVLDMRFAYDPATQLLFWTDLYSNTINSLLIKPGSNNSVNRVILNLRATHIAVDSCGGYIYWTSSINIERARFDGSEREVVIRKYAFSRAALAIDPHTQKMYWVDNQGDYSSPHFQISIESADLNGENRRTLYIKRNYFSLSALAVSKDFIYWRTAEACWQLSKNPPRDRVEELKEFLSIPYIPGRDLYVDGIASNYSIEDQTQGIQNCEALKSLLPINSVSDSTDVSLLCVHGTKVSGESRCECTQGYSGERCEVPVCHNYCFQGDCSVSVEGQPKCRCKAGYSGERCEVYACHEYCSNNGICSLNAESKPVCQCTGQYEGERCDVPVFLVKCLQTVSLLRDILNTDVTQDTLAKGV